MNEVEAIELANALQHARNSGSGVNYVVSADFAVLRPQMLVNARSKRVWVVYFTMEPYEGHFAVYIDDDTGLEILPNDINS